MSENNNSFPIISQTQSDTDDMSVYEESDNEDSPITDDSKGSEYDDVAKQLNFIIYETIEYLSAKLKVITDHIHLAGILEFTIEYINGDQSLYSIGLIKYGYPLDDDTYVLSNDLGHIYN